MSKRIYFLLVLLWMLLIFATSCTVVFPDQFFRWIHTHVIRDESVYRGFAIFWGSCWFLVVKGWHALEFAILFVLCLSVLNRWQHGPRRRNVVWAAIIAGLFAVSDEWHQTFIPGRGGTALDVLIDCVGIGIAALYSWRKISFTERCCELALGTSLQDAKPQGTQKLKSQ